MNWRNSQIRQLTKRIAIIGVQRSGTTLIGSIFRVRPDVTYFGDGKGVPALRDFHFPEKDIAVYKVTQITQFPKMFEPDVFRIFCRRNICDTVSSMISLDWIRPDLSGSELKDCVISLTGSENDRLLKYVSEKIQDLKDYKKEDLHKIGALTVAVKKSFLKDHVNVLPVDYEHLVSQPYSVIKEICDFCRIDLDPIMFEHEKHLTGELHGTKFTRKIDRKSVGKSTLTHRQRQDCFLIEKEVKELS